MKTKLLKQVRDKILAEPNQFNIDYFFYSELSNGKTPSNCGTAACIGGWGVCIANKLTPSEASYREFTTDEMGNVLGLTVVQAHRLFFEERWPERFCSKSKDSMKLRARRAADRIDHFIKTKGKE